MFDAHGIADPEVLSKNNLSQVLMLLVLVAESFQRRRPVPILESFFSQCDREETEELFGG